MSTFFQKQQQVAALDPRLGALLGQMGFYNLKALIKAIRSCKTQADERALIQKESFSIRTSFKEEDAFARYNNVAKLLYIHMLGYPAHFGQIECLKLVASPRFADKRLGYLGIMLLLDENQEVLTLVTNSLKNDMNHSNMHIVGLALCTFANISSEEMSRDLCNEVEKLMGSANSYIRRKAALCAMRITRKVPDLLDNFVERARNLLSDKNHGVLLCGVTLVTDMCLTDESLKEGFRKASAVPLLVRHLKALVTTGYSPEHDVSGITDPFLQVKILRLLRIFGKDSVEASEVMNDMLAQVATNTEASKNVGNAILYETVLTILEIEAESGLRVMAINILGRFLGNRDNNIRYVALNTLSKVVAIDTQAVQRHRNIILDCLRDGDISIRRRALELSYALINESNVRVLTRELLAFLEVADNEFKLGMTTQIALAADRFAPNRRWHIDTMLRTLKLAGNYVSADVLASFLRLVAHTPELQSYTAHKLYAALQADISQESLSLAAVWVIGEFGDVLLNGGGVEGEGGVPVELKDTDLLDLISSVVQSPYTNTLIRQYVLTALVKLSTRIDASSPSQSRVREMLRSYEDSVEVEIQQRAVEFGSLFEAATSLRDGVLEKMPPPEIRTTVVGTVSEKRSVGSTRTDKDALLDLMGDETTPASPVAANGGAAAAQNTQDLLADIFGAGNGSAEAAAGGGGMTASASGAPQGKASVNDILSLFGNGGASGGGVGPSAPATPAAGGVFGDLAGLSGASSPPTAAAASSTAFPLFPTSGTLPSSSTPAPPPPTVPASVPAPARPAGQSYTAYDDKGLKITFTPNVDPSRPTIANILASFTATGVESVENVQLQAAVPKSQKLQMLAISNPTVSVGATESQQMRVMAPAGSRIRLRLRIAFSTASSGPVQEQADFNGFPADLLPA